MRNALIAGAGGLTGSYLLDMLLKHDEYHQVLALVRKPLPVQHKKLIQVETDFDTLENYSPPFPVTDVYCTLGTTIRNAGSQSAFRKVDHEYVIKLGKFCAKNQVQRMLVVSAMGADPHSGIFYNRVKGEMEAELKESGIPSIWILRPSLLLGKRAEFRIGESIAQFLMGGLKFLFVAGLLRYKPIHVKQVASNMIRCAFLHETGFHIVDNAEMHRHH